MKNLILLLFLVFSVGAFAQNNPAAIREQMAKIRQSTNWDDPGAARKANEQIHELSKKLMMTGKPKGELPKNLSKEETERAKEDAVDDNMKMMEQILKSAAGGESADILLAEPIREEIKEEYEEDDAPKKINQQFLQEMTVLVIDMSSPTVKYSIDLMKNYKSIKTLVIKGGKNGAMVNLPDILDRASAYPLEQLYIINFRNFVSTIPEQVGTFKKLSTLSLFNNKLSQLPGSVGSMVGLDSLFVDQNPIATLEPAIANLKNLKKLGITRTSITEEEVIEIKSLLPNCQIQQK